MFSVEYGDFVKAIEAVVPAKDIITDPLHTAVYGTDASFYHLTPKVVVNVNDEHQVRYVIREANKRDLPVTFRAAGTSLSGQAITDSILIRLGGSGFKEYRVFDNAGKIRLQPGIIGGHANLILSEFNKKIGPDPASIDCALVGGILANNASGMCCGVDENSYKTLDSLRIVTADAAVVDTGDDKSRQEFARTHGHILDGITEIRNQIFANDELADRIRYKFKIKNTTGYSLNAFVDYEDPFEIMSHLMIGSEGTLGFISDAVYNTVVEHPYKASAFMLFEDMHTACSAIPLLRDTDKVAAAELIDRAGLQSVADKAGVPAGLADLGPNVTALLVETRASLEDDLKAQINVVIKALDPVTTIGGIEFTDDPEKFGAYWKIRKGLLPAVGAVRETGTTVIIEDVAFATEKLADATIDLQALFAKYNYDEALIFGHAFEGNIHFVFTQDFSDQEEVLRYSKFMDDVVNLVVDKYDGSLKAEHGTGRNMAPFVEKEWGEAAYAIMKDVKKLFDPKNLLNPGVIINKATDAHIQNLKSLPAANEIADKCIECGFCEPVCPSKNLSFTPRQRVAGRRILARKEKEGLGKEEMKKLTKSYVYPGLDTCAADGLCATRCPVGIDTGKMVKSLREEAWGPLAHSVAEKVADNFGTVAKIIPPVLNVVDKMHDIAGTKMMDSICGGVRKASMDMVPLWNKEMPTGPKKIVPEEVDRSNPLKVVYFPSCASRSMSGAAHDETVLDDLPERTMSLLKKAGFEIIYPGDLDKLCCGQAFESKGFLDLADKKSYELADRLLVASDFGAIPILFDTSPCYYRMKEMVDERITIYEPIEFVLRFMMDHLEFAQQDVKVALHPTCSTRKLGLEGKLQELAEKCATEVVMPEDIYCCGFAGDRGFNFPELNKAALEGLEEHVCECDAGYSTSKTCEVGLSFHGKIPYRSILYLVDDATTAKQDVQENE